MAEPITHFCPECDAILDSKSSRVVVVTRLDPRSGDNEIIVFCSLTHMRKHFEYEASKERVK